MPSRRKRALNLGATGLVVVLSMASGCSTYDRLLKFPEAPQIYGGVRNYDAFWGPHAGEWRGTGMIGLPFAADAAATLVLDTLLLPATVPAEMLSEENARDGDEAYESSVEYDEDWDRGKKSLWR